MIVARLHLILNEYVAFSSLSTTGIDLSPTQSIPHQTP
ncbi:hypothetical protein ALP86_102201 [Pseudomonas amygdali pv. mori]|uniref:Uncharacterized protein n=1 Tax=Pseudomonas amygdali pv. mori TaxID=34065 RepID=A0A3M4VG19_PSEA0|nr:hypothetical protein ALQ05_101675 [Pseudomonas amygdali pv. mori]RMR50786.1 hypothetical protein ALP86_102201 [Pseudomonas amygdali pv. mori]RMT16290.1 hypothetical protein ALP52_102058 [Pseudomonas amygdali pv. mori]